MGIIERYITWEWTKWFGLGLFFLLSLLILQFVSEDLDIFSKANGDFDLGWLLIRCLSFLPWLLPVSCFLATFLTVAFLMMRGELVGILTCSFSWIYCFRSVIVLGCFISLLSWLFVIYGDQIQKSIDSNRPKISSTSNFQMKIGSSRLWYFDSFDLENKKGINLHLYAFDSKGNDAYRIRARKAKWDNNQWVFEDGSFLGFSSMEGLPLIDQEGKIIWDRGEARTDLNSGKESPLFNKKFARMNLPEAMDDPEIHMLISRKPNSLSFLELGNVLGKYPEAGSEYLFPFRYRFYQLVWNSTACFLSIVCSLLVIMKNPQQKMGKLICLSLLGILFFYSIRTFCDSLGENGILPAVICAALPYLGTFLLAFVYFVISKSLISAFISKES